MQKNKFILGIVKFYEENLHLIHQIIIKIAVFMTTNN